MLKVLSGKCFEGQGKSSGEWDEVRGKVFSVLDTVSNDLFLG